MAHAFPLVGFVERTDAVAQLARSAFTLVTEAQQAMGKAFDAPRAGVLRVVVLEGPLRPSAVGERLDLAPSSVTRHVQALEDAGHLTVRADPADARTCLIEATAEGRAELGHLQDVGVAVFEDVVAGWSAPDMQTLARLMSRLTEDWARRGPAARRQARAKNQPRWRFRPQLATQEGRS
jgi:DNA-binding MarR family transcriptional regulator